MTAEMGKENEKRERSKESKEKESKESKEKESCYFFAFNARVREELPPVIDVRTPPTLDVLLAFAHLRCGFYDDAFTREWYRIMTDEFAWCHPETGEPIHHWPAYFRLWRLNRTRFNALLNPERFQSRSVTKQGKSANWRGTRKEDLDDILG